MSKELIKQLIKETVLSEQIKKKNVSYTALVLTRQGHNELISKMANEFPIDEWEKVAHHVTLNMGSWKGDPNLIGKEYTIEAVSFAKDGLVIACGVKMNDTGLPSKANPHITIAVNRAAGGKPAMSNNLDWTMETLLDSPIILTATLLEVEQGMNEVFADEY